MEVADRWKDEVKACPAHKPGEKKRQKMPGSQARENCPENCPAPYMGQFLQGGNFGHFVS